MSEILRNDSYHKGQASAIASRLSHSLAAVKGLDLSNGKEQDITVISEIAFVKVFVLFNVALSTLREVDT